MRKGFWNGTENIEYKVIIYEVTKGKIPTWWQNAFIGKLRQGILIRRVDKLGLITDEPFIIDNHDGMGWLKIQSGGSPNKSHRSVLSEDINIYSYDVKDDDIVKVFNPEVYNDDNITFEKYLKKYHPESFIKMTQLKKELTNIQKNQN